MFSFGLDLVMNPVVILNTPFVQVALPIMITFMAAAWLNGKRLDDFRADINRRFDEMRSDINRRFDEVNKRFDDVNSRFDSVERRLEMIQASTHDAEIRITRLESR